jgi:2-polyprenyl-3-methyl-5-hydroxy-6-metoxy-1,4-benzoquinol methylase
MQPKIDIYDDFASEYARLVVEREEKGVHGSQFMPAFLDVIGDVSGLTALDAGCGEGYLARVLTGLGAKVTGIDVASRLVEMARKRDAKGEIDYQIANLSQPLPAYRDHFDLCASFFVLNDVYDHRGFLSTLGSVIKPGGRAVLFMNNPYSFVVRGAITDYFEPGNTAFPYRGMAAQGVKVYFYQRTLEEYLDASFAAGFQLQRLVDVRSPEGTFTRSDATLIPVGYQFPFCMILSLVKS